MRPAGNQAVTSRVYDVDMPIRRHLTIGIMLLSLLSACLSSQMLAMQQSGQFAELIETAESAESESSAAEASEDLVVVVDRAREVVDPRGVHMIRTSDVRRCLLDVSPVLTPPPERA